MDDNVYFRHFRINPKQNVGHDGIISIAYTFKEPKFEDENDTIEDTLDDESMSGGVIEYAIAICSPKDTFCKKKAVKVLLERFHNDETAVFMYSDLTAKMVLPLIVMHYNSHIIDPKEYGIRGFANSEEVFLPRHAQKIPLEACSELQNLLY